MDFRAYFQELLEFLQQTWVRDLGLVFLACLLTYYPAIWVSRIIERRSPEAAVGRATQIFRWVLHATIWPLFAFVVSSIAFAIWMARQPTGADERFEVLTVLIFFWLYRVVSELSQRLLDVGPRRTRLRRFMLPLLLVFATLEQIGGLDDLLRWVDRPMFTLGADPISLLSFIVVIGIIVLFGIAGRLVSRFIGNRLLPNLGVDQALSDALSTVTRYVINVLGVLVALETLGFDLSTLQIGFGALGVGIGFGLQGLVHNFVSGIILLFERTIKRGDVIEVGGLSARVLRIGLRSSVVRTRQGHEVILPNSDMVTSPVINFSYSESRVRLDVPVGVSYNADPNQVHDLLLEVAKQEERVLDRPGPTVLFVEYGDSSINFQLRVWVASEWISPQVRSALYFSAWYKLKEAGIEIPFPQRDLHLRSGELKLAERSQPSSS